MSQTNPPAPVPEYIRDAQGKLYRVSDLLSQKTPSVHIQLIKRRYNKDQPYRPNKYTLEDLHLLANATADECLAKWPERTRSQINAQRGYARDKLRQLAVISSQKKP